MENKYDGIMRQINFWYVPGHKAIGEETLHDFEKAIGYGLPTDYRVFLGKYGLSTGESYTRVTDYENPNEWVAALGVFYGLNSEVRRDLLRIRSMYGSRLPSHLLPIADSAGGEICLSLAGEDRGRLYWWDPHETPDDPYDALDLIAYDFDSFMKSLRVYEE